MEKLVIVNSEQFGYNNATFYYCKYLRNKYDITYIGWDHELENITLENIKIISVSRHGGVFRIFRMLQSIWNETRQNKTIIFIKYFKFISAAIRVMRLNNSMVLDIRTGSVAKSTVRRSIENIVLKFEAKFFKNITVISNSLAKKLVLDNVSTILPLGADIISDKSKSFEQLRLLYVGTLHNRNIITLVEGVALYFSRNKGKEKSLTLVIVGDGFADEKDILQSLINKYELNAVIELTGWVPHNQLEQYFDDNNIGVSYIPLIDCFDAQPPTKTLEYLMSGMPVIATKTSENSLIIKHDNGVLIGDAAEDVCAGIEKIKVQLEAYSSINIRKEADCYSWKKIIKNLDCYLTKLHVELK